MLAHVFELAALMIALKNVLEGYSDDFTGQMPKRLMGLIFASPYLVAAGLSYFFAPIGFWVLSGVLSATFCAFVSTTLTD